MLQILVSVSSRTDFGDKISSIQLQPNMSESTPQESIMVPLEVEPNIH